MVGRSVRHESKVATAAGVSAGIDLALWLAGEIVGREQAEAIQLTIEYDPHPTFSAGHMSRASKETQQSAKKMMDDPMPRDQDCLETLHRCNPYGKIVSPVLVRRADGVEGILRPNVHLAFGDCRSRIDVRVEIIYRENLPIAGSTQHDDFPMLAGDVDFAVDTDG